MNLVLDNNQYDDFLKTRFVSGSFLQASLWEKFLDKIGLKFWRATVLDQERVIATCLFYERKLPFSRSYFYAPKGPIISPDISQAKQAEALELILSKVRDITIDTKKREEIFFKTEINTSQLLPKRLKKSSDIQPRDSWVLDLDKDYKNLLAAMHPKTRYNIALAVKKGVKIKFSKNEEDLKSFFELNKKTASRNQITTHPENHYHKLFKTLIEQDAGELALAQVNDRVVAANILVYFGSSVTYLHGASDYNFRQYMAPQLLQWESIKRAMDLGKKIYDFWGIAPVDGSKQNWEGFSRFKKSFGGRAIFSPGGHDLIYDNFWYNLYNLSAKIKFLLKK